MSDERTTTHEFPVKCRNCGLHYSVFSWSENWPFDKERDGGYCPECGIKGSKMVWHRTVTKFIFEVVPGGAEMLALTRPEDAPRFGIPQGKPEA